MILDSLLELVETLKARIDEHGEQLRQSEALTRYALIDPLLRELGWDTENPALVIPEYKSGSGSADYALLTGNRPAMMVEAKKLGTPLQDSVVSQGIQYCLMEGTQYFSVTDGQHWALYETHRPVPIDEKRIIGFDLKGESAAEVCLKALALWRPSVQSGHAAPGLDPVVQPPEDPPVSQAPITVEPPIVVDEYEWHPLTQVSSDGGQKPVEMKLPDGDLVPTPYWNSLMTKSTRWLLDNGHLAHSSLPIRSARRYLASTESVHPDGTQMKRGIEVSGVWVEANYSASNCIRNAIAIIKHANQDPSKFKVRFS